MIRGHFVNIPAIDPPFPCTILAGWGKVCIRKTAHKSTGDDGSLPSEGSRQRTSKSLHNIPTSDRGVSSGARQSTCTVDASPSALIASNETTVLRTTRVSSKGPSMIRRLDMFSDHRNMNGENETHRCGWTRGLGNRPRIRDCHWTSLRRDSDSRFPSFMLLASDDISAKAFSKGS